MNTTPAVPRYTRMDKPEDHAPAPWWHVIMRCDGCNTTHEFDWQGSEDSLTLHLAGYVECHHCRQGRLFP